jgi:hypothetical protein
LRSGRPVAAIFQQATPPGAAIRVAFDGAVPVLPEPVVADRDPEPDFWPDELPPDD